MAYVGNIFKIIKKLVDNYVSLLYKYNKYFYI